MSGWVEKAIHHGRVDGRVTDSTPRVDPRESFSRARRIRESRTGPRAEFIGRSEIFGVAGDIAKGEWRKA
jgi:hypothetical protein